MYSPRVASFFILAAVAAWHPLTSFAAAAANPWQDPAAIRAAAQRFLQSFIGSQHQGKSQITLDRLDPRLKVKSCRAALDAFMPPGGRAMGNTTVGVRCPDPGGWSIYVSARIDIFGQVLVTRQPLARGARISADDLELVERNLANLPYGYYTDPQPVTGQVTKRTIATATVITPPMVQAPKLIRRGERVTVIAESGALSIRSVGKALSDGQSGDSIQVRTDGSQRIIDGIVVSPGVIKVTL